MASTRRVAVVTGANKGIGFAIVKALCKQFHGDVFLTARNEARGQEAVKQLNGEGLFPKFHQLDITDTASIERIKSFLETNYSGLDVLVNNAGVSIPSDSNKPTPKEAEMTMLCNFWGTLDVCSNLYPLLRPHARVVNISSEAGQLATAKSSETLRKKFISPENTIKDVELLMTDFLNSCNAGTCQADGWDGWAYAVSKLGVSLISIIQQRDFDKDPREDILVYACCPGFVDTDMTFHEGTCTTDEGADTPVYLAMLPKNASTPRGEFGTRRQFNQWPKVDVDAFPDKLKQMLVQYDYV